MNKEFDKRQHPIPEENKHELIKVTIAGEEKEIETKPNYNMRDAATLSGMKYDAFIARVYPLVRMNKEIDTLLKESRNTPNGKFALDLKGLETVTNAVLGLNDRRRERRKRSSGQKPTNTEVQNQTARPNRQTLIPNETRSPDAKELLKPPDAINLLVTRDIVGKIASNKSHEISPVTNVNLAKYLRKDQTLVDVYGRVAESKKRLGSHFIGAFAKNIEDLWGKDKLFLDSELSYVNSIRGVKNQIIDHCKRLEYRQQTALNLIRNTAQVLNIPLPEKYRPQ